MAECWLVHMEHGAYSDWNYEPVAVFSSRDAAVAWLEASRWPVTYDQELERYEDSYPLDSWEGVAAHARPTQLDDGSWELEETTDGEPVHNLTKRMFFVGALPMDPVIEGET